MNTKTVSKKTSKKSRMSGVHGMNTKPKGSSRKTKKNSEEVLPVKKKSSFLKKTGKVQGYSLAGLTGLTVGFGAVGIYNIIKKEKEIHKEVNDFKKNFFGPKGDYDVGQKTLELQKIKVKILKYLATFDEFEAHTFFPKIITDLKFVDKILNKLGEREKIKPEDLK